MTSFIFVGTDSIFEIIFGTITNWHFPNPILSKIECNFFKKLLLSHFNKQNPITTAQTRRARDCSFGEESNFVCPECSSLA